jgi:hypothetical protein
MSGKWISIERPPERGVVGDGDGADDGQSEAVVVVDAGAVESLEGVEEAVDLLGRDHRPGVRDGDDGLAVEAGGTSPHTPLIISLASHPLPRPRINRPLDKLSRSAASRAVKTGWRYTAQQMFRPRPMRSVVTARAAR